jgi:hypothetical protein
MGLDITAYAIPAGSTQLAGGQQIHTWRKHHELANWLSALEVSRGGQAWDEPAQSITLTSADLDELESSVLNGALPDNYDRDPDYWKANDLAFIAKARVVLAADMTVEIVASW